MALTEVNELNKVDRKWLSFADDLGGTCKSKVRTGAKPHITQNGRTTLVVSALKG